VTATAEELDRSLGRLFASDPEAMADALSVWMRLRDEAPVLRFGDRVLVSRYADCKHVLRDTTHLDPAVPDRDVEVSEAPASFSEDEKLAWVEVANFERHYMNRSGDSEKHARLRRIAHRAFTPASIAATTDSIERYSAALLDDAAAAAEGGVADLAPFAYTLPLMVICDMLGVPAGDRELIHGWSGRLGRNRGGVEAGPVLDARDAMRDFRAYVAEIVERHRVDSSSVSPLVASLMDADEQERLTEIELAGMFVLLLFAGHETTTNLLGIGTLELLRNEEQRRALCDDPGLAAGATEELLRFVSPVQWQARSVGEACAFDGVEVRPGEQAVGMIAAANRDPAVFPEPDRLDITRANADDHLSLGFGIHFCMGAALARAEGRLGFAALAARFPQMELAADPATLRFGGHALLRRLESLPVRLGPESRP